MESSENIQPASASLRPTFLTVICILTFIGSGWGIIGGIREYATADTRAAMAGEAMDKAKDQMSDQPHSGFAERILNAVSSGLSAENIRKSSAIRVISCLLTLLGGILMWQLRKIGFYAYITGIFIGVIGPLLLLSGFIGWASSGWTGFIGLIFIILYGVNLRYMTR